MDKPSAQILLGAIVTGLGAVLVARGESPRGGSVLLVGAALIAWAIHKFGRAAPAS